VICSGLNRRSHITRFRDIRLLDQSHGWNLSGDRVTSLSLPAVADPADLEAVYRIEAMTNDRLREEAGDLALVPPADRVSGPGTSPIMAAFTHLDPQGSHFTDGSYGVFYTSLTIETSVRLLCIGLYSKAVTFQGSTSVRAPCPSISASCVVLRLRCDRSLAS